MILDDIVEKRKEQLAKEMKRTSLEEQIRKAQTTTHTVLDFKKALKGEHLAVISEVKKASPSKGLIKQDFHPVDIACEYEAAGANAISVLTEEHYFQGSSEYLRAIRAQVNIPLLRKDFIIDPYQIYEARAIGADAILLIAAILDTDTLLEYKAIADQIGLFCLSEVHNEKELESVLKAGFDIIGINNRDLKTFHVDLATTGRLAQAIPKGKLVVSESGVRDNQDMKEARALGADAVLIGETLMRSESITAELTRLREGV